MHPALYNKVIAEIDKKTKGMPFTSRRVVRAQLLSAAKKRQRLRGVIANEYRHVRRGYLHIMAMAKSGIVAGSISAEEVDDYRREERALIRQHMEEFTKIVTPT